MSSEQKIKTYQEYRKVGMELNTKLFKLIPKEALMECASLLNLIEDDTIVVDEEADMDRLSEICIHDYFDEEDKNAVRKYSESENFSLSSNIEKDIVKAKLEAITSLYLVDYVKRDCFSIGLVDVFNSYKKVEIIDIGLSQSLKPKKTYIFTRIMNFDNFSSTSGVSYPFDKSKYKKLQKEYNKIYKSLPEVKSKTKRSISFFHLNKIHGRPMRYI